MARDDLHFRLRIPEELKAEVEAAAELNHRSMTAEIVHRLERSLSSNTVYLSTPLRMRIEEAAKRNGRSLREEVIACLDEAYPRKKISHAELLAVFELWEADLDDPQQGGWLPMKPEVLRDSIARLREAIASGEAITDEPPEPKTSKPSGSEG